MQIATQEAVSALPSRTKTFAALASDFILINTATRWRSKAQVGAMHYLLEVCAAPLANKHVDEITSDDVEHVARATCQRDRTLRAIREVFNLAIARGYCISNPADHWIMKYRLPVTKNGAHHHTAMDYHDVP